MNRATPQMRRIAKRLMVAEIDGLAIAQAADFPRQGGHFGLQRREAGLQRSAARGRRERGVVHCVSVALTRAAAPAAQTSLGAPDGQPLRELPPPMRIRD